MVLPLLVVLSLTAAPTNAKELSAGDAFAQGMQHYRDADFEGAIPLFQTAVKGTPDSNRSGKARSEVWLGLCFMNIGNESLAKSSFRAALLADMTVVLPDEAPPAATPLFANIKGDLERTAPKPQVTPPAPKEQPKEPPKEVVKEPPKETKPDVPTAHADVPTAHADEHPELVEPVAEAQVDSSASLGSRIPSWLPAVTSGVTTALGATAIGFEIVSSNEFGKAERATTAAESTTFARRGNADQHVARTVGICAIGTAAISVALYLLKE